MTNRQKFTEVFDCEIVRRDTGEPVPGHCKILIAESEHFDEWLQKEYEPSAQPGWIPWDSGGFPEESGTYTVTAYDGAKRRVTYAKYQKRLKRWELTGARAYWRVLAWMPHIEPWEGEKEDG